MPLSRAKPARPTMPRLVSTGRLVNRPIRAAACTPVALRLVLDFLNTFPFPRSLIRWRPTSGLAFGTLDRNYADRPLSGRLRLVRDELWGWHLLRKCIGLSQRAWRGR